MDVFVQNSYVKVCAYLFRMPGFTLALVVNRIQGISFQPRRHMIVHMIGRENRTSS